MGHKKIAFVKGSTVSLNTSRSLARYKLTLEHYGIPYDESLIFDAIQYSTDDNAIGGLLCLKENGIRVPDDISVVSINNIPESQFCSPALTTSGTDGNPYLFYEGVIHYLIMQIEKDNENEEITKQLSEKLHEDFGVDRLIIRESVKKID